MLVASQAPSVNRLSSWITTPNYVAEVATPLKVLAFLSFQNIKPMRKKRKSKPRRIGLGTSFSYYAANTIASPFPSVLSCRSGDVISLSTIPRLRD
jgi:hypothetical protein